MRILIVADKLTGGAGNVAQQLAYCFSKREGNTVFLLIDASGNPKYDLSRVHIIDRKIVPVKLNNPIRKIRRYISSSQELGNTINSCNADVILSFLNSISPEVLISQWHTKTPIIVSERSNPYMEWAKTSRILRMKWWLSYRRADMIVYQFRCFEPFFKYAYQQNKTCVIPNMIVESSTVEKDDDEKTHNPVKFATIATLYPVKRIGLMIDIFAKLLAKYPNIELNIYGDGPDRAGLERQAKNLGIERNVCFHGHIVDTIEALRKNDVLLMTSEREGFPNVVLEAMEAAVPTVMFKCHEGLKELIKEGTTGFLIEQDDVTAFIERLEYLIQNPQVIDELGKNAFSAKEEYSIESVFPLWESCVENVLLGI